MFTPSYFRRNTLSIAIGTVMLTSTCSALSAAEDQADSAESTLPTITVTASKDNSGKTEGTGSYLAKSSRSASKLNLSLKETPQSVSVITRDQIEQRGLNIIDDILTATPGVTVIKVDSERSGYYARGFSINNQQIDGLTIGEKSPRIDSFFFDRIEVVKGSTGLSGSTGDPSATINMIRKRPTKEFSGNTAISFSRWDNTRVEADVSIPLTQDGSIRSRVMAAHKDGNSYMDYYSLESTAAMATIEADITPNTIASLGFQYQDNNPQGSTWGAVPYWNLDGSLANLPRNFSLANTWNSIQENDRTAFADIQHTFDNGWLIKAVASHTLSQSSWLMAYGGSGFPNPADGKGLGLWSIVYPESESKKTNLEVYASGSFSLLDRQHDLVLGYSGYKRDNTDPEGKLIGDFGNQVTCVPNQWGGTNCNINDYRKWNGYLNKPSYEITNTTKSSQQNQGAYGSVRLNLADPLKVIIGARYSEYKATNDDNADVKVDHLTPFLGVLYDINDVVTAYASYSDMFQPTTNKNRINKYLDPETGINYELGVKADLLDGQLLATAAAFWSEKDNLAVEDKEYNEMVKADPTKANNGLQSAYLATGQGLKVNGFELEATGLIKEGWNITAGYTYVNAKTNANSSEATNIPLNSVKLFSSYTLPADLWNGADRLTIGGGVNWQSEIENNWGGAPANTDGIVRQDSYFLASASASYKLNQYLTAAVNVNNLFDEKYYQNVGFYNGVYWGEPRNVTLTLRTKF
jgi:outer membrane receptor for ferric coprogen and ferric-rhodotorulic acid